MKNNCIVSSLEELLLYLNDIDEYVNAILLYHKGNNKLDLDEIIDSIKLFLLK